MSWFKVDDGLWGSPKWIGLPAGARALWVTAGSYCMDQLTDGRVPERVLGLLGGRRRDADALVKAGLWERDVEGWLFHDWSAYQPSREQVEAERAAARERQRRARERASSARRAAGESASSGWRAADSTAENTADGRQPEGAPGDVSAGQGSASRRDIAVTHAVTHAHVTPVVTVPPTRPDPTVPPTEVQGGTGGGSSAPSDAPADAGATATPKAKRGTRIPEPFTVTPEMVAWARSECPGLDHKAVTEKFIDHWRAQPGQRGVKLDWVATWRNWMRREHEQRAARGPRTATPTRGAGFWGKEVTLP